MNKLYKFFWYVFNCSIRDYHLSQYRELKEFVNNASFICDVCHTEFQIKNEIDSKRREDLK